MFVHSSDELEQSIFLKLKESTKYKSSFPQWLSRRGVSLSSLGFLPCLHKRSIKKWVLRLCSFVKVYQARLVYFLFLINIFLDFHTPRFTGDSTFFAFMNRDTAIRKYMHRFLAT